MLDPDPHLVLAYEHSPGDLNDLHAVVYPVVEARISLTVVPTPPTALLLLCMWPCRRMRRANRTQPSPITHGAPP
jgi:hypothetical protein